MSLEGFNRFIIASISGIVATLHTHPFDVCRIQLQIDNKNYYSGLVDCALKVKRKYGIIKGWYSGVSAGILRQISYGASRTTIYSFFWKKVETFFLR